MADVKSRNISVTGMVPIAMYLKVTAPRILGQCKSTTCTSQSEAKYLAQVVATTNHNTLCYYPIPTRQVLWRTSRSATTRDRPAAGFEGLELS